jgi:hypothetical protein
MDIEVGTLTHLATLWEEVLLAPFYRQTEAHKETWPHGKTRVQTQGLWLQIPCD